MTSALRSAVVRFGDTVALDGVSLEVEPGTVAAVVGGDGAGKTTLLRCLVGEVRLTSGEVELPAPERIGYLTAGSGSWAALTVRQNMDFVGGIYGLRGEALLRRRDELLDRADLAAVADRPAALLSGGMRRKLGFCMAVLHRPEVLVLDEPSTGVDPVSRVELWRLVSEAAAGGCAVAMSTTYLDEGERAGTLLALDGGVTLAAGTPSDVLGSLPGRVTVTERPVRPAWAWRRGRTYHEYWPEGGDQPVPAADAVAVSPDLEDVVVALSMLRRGGRG
ncbi:MAG TPA: ABC transporter ATP-binding protein [Acidimicrobiales bacterium]|nr:ABC transporter ATP-binding protein [Actinomycetes bacterium]HVN49922.1 ABC transporter ATP-binding protein [Acidimicrobiales bacterium]